MPVFGSGLDGRWRCGGTVSGGGLFLCESLPSPYLLILGCGLSLGGGLTASDTSGS